MKAGSVNFGRILLLDKLDHIIFNFPYIAAMVGYNVVIGDSITAVISRIGGGKSEKQKYTTPSG